MDSLTKKEKLYSDITLSLKQLYQNSKQKVNFSDHNDLLIMESSSDVAGFVLVDACAKKEYSRSYNKFKSLYREMHSTWQERNLSFVLCYLSTNENDEAFAHEVEMDAYFCRKYVIFISPGKNEIIDELFQLPFLPIVDDDKNYVKRPKSAQSLLQSIGIDSSLARHIISPLVRSASGIVEDILTDYDTIPNYDFKGPDSSINNIRQNTSPTTRIRKIIIEGFRAYRNPCEFDLDADVVVIYGPNGYGKTSLFDAIDYLCTGRFGRLCRRNIDQETFIDLARHLSAENNNGSITMGFRSEDSVYQIKRYVNNWTYAYIGDKKINRTDTLQHISSAIWNDKKERIEILESLFRATHLFNQSTPEFFIDFEKYSALSSDLVSRTFALEDYSSGGKKTQEVISIIKRKLDKEKESLKFIRDQKVETQKQIAALPIPDDIGNASQQTNKIAADLLLDLRMHDVVAIDDHAVTSVSVREWRSLVEAELSSIRNNLTILGKIESNFADYIKKKDNLKNTTQLLAKLSTEIDKMSEDKLYQENLIKRLVNDQNKQINIEVDADSKSAALIGLLKQQGLARQVNSTMEQWQHELISVEKESLDLAIKKKKLNLLCNESESKENSLFDDINKKRKHIQLLDEISDTINSYESSKAEICIINKSIDETENCIEIKKRLLIEQQKHITTIVADLAVKEKEYRNASASNSKMTQLLDEIEMFIKDEVCPTCGVIHNSVDDLAKKVKSQKETRSDYLESLAERYQAAQKALDNAKTISTNQSLDVTLKQDVLEAQMRELARNQKLINEFEKLVTQADLSISDDLQQNLSDRLVDERNLLAMSMDQLDEVRNRIEELKRQIANINNLSEKNEEARKQANDSLKPLEQHIVLLRSKASENGLSLEMNSSEIASKQKYWVTIKSESQKIISDLSVQIENSQEVLSQIVSKLDEFKFKYEKSNEVKKFLERDITNFENLTSKSMNSDTYEWETITTKHKQVAEKEKLIESFFNRVNMLEHSLDAATRSAVLSELKVKLDSFNMQDIEITKKVQRLSSMHRMFIQINDILKKQNAEAIKNLINAFGPLTSLLQKRLRAVHGFGDVNLQPTNDDIRVVVDWAGKSVKPTDYFSDSQKQILMLSIFLSGRLTQTWSSFAPILLDDPVTHFDDMNAYSFVELIRGLVMASPGKRQFIISTCEERLFELMQQKFGDNTITAKFYRFEGITNDGPIVKLIE